MHTHTTQKKNTLYIWLLVPIINKTFRCCFSLMLFKTFWFSLAKLHLHLRTSAHHDELFKSHLKLVVGVYFKNLFDGSIRRAFILLFYGRIFVAACSYGARRHQLFNGAINSVSTRSEDLSREEFNKIVKSLGAAAKMTHFIDEVSGQWIKFCRNVIV